jgi:hypothetical protein
MKLRDLANQRRRFGYRRLFIVLRREREPSGVNRIYRLHREEGYRFANAKRGDVPSAHVRRSWSRRRQMLAGRWISSMISSPVADASASSTSSMMW